MTSPGAPRGPDPKGAASEPEGEFAFIREHLAPLSAGVPGAFGLTDDAAELPLESLAATGGLVVTADLLTAGVHFLADDPLERVAQKALRVNLSDLAAKGARPLYYALSIAWPAAIDATGRARFAAGLAADQQAFGVTLLGGDTTATSGPLTVAVTAFGGLAGHARGMVRRAGAQPGDRVYVTGTLGDGGLGLRARRGALDALGPEHVAALCARYQRPTPRLAAIEPLRRFARAAIDVSDGLIADAGHIARASGVTMRLEAARTPLSPAAAAWLAGQPDADAARAELAAAGDDYEILFCAPESEAAGLEAACAAAGLQATAIGRVESGPARVLFVNDADENIAPPRAGFTHF